MKVSPVAQGTGMPAGSEPSPGKSASSDRMARAKAVALGQKPESVQVVTSDPVIIDQQNNLQKIKMKTQRSVYRDLPVEQTEVPIQESPQSNIPDKVEQTQAVSADTKPIDPQLAVQAQMKRAVQRAVQEKETEIANLKKQLEEIPSASKEYIPISQLKSNPLSVLTENGVTYDQLTEAILSQQNDQSPAILKLQSEIETLKKGLENQSKNQVERDEQAKKQVLNQMEKDALLLIAQSDEYEGVRDATSAKEEGGVRDVIKLIEKTFDATGEVLDVDEALKLVEEAVIERNLRRAKLKKVQSSLAATLPEQIHPQDSNNNVRAMRTLTNRDNARPVSDRRSRAINAFYGRK